MQLRVVAKTVFIGFIDRRRIGLLHNFNSTQRFSVTDLLQVVEAGSDAFIAVTVKGVKVDAGSAIYTTVDFGSVEDDVAINIHDSGRDAGVDIDEISIGIGWIIRRSMSPSRRGVRLKVELRGSFGKLDTEIIGFIVKHCHAIYGSGFRQGIVDSFPAIVFSVMDRFVIDSH